MAMSRLTIWLLSALALVLGSAGPGYTQTSRTGGKRPVTFSPASLQAEFGLAPSLFKGARFYSYPQILAQTLADKSPGAAEVHTYLVNPVQWQ